MVHSFMDGFLRVIRPEVTSAIGGLVLICRLSGSSGAGLRAEDSEKGQLGGGPIASRLATGGIVENSSAADRWRYLALML